MNFSAWTRALADRGIRVVSPSHPTPIELWALLEDGQVVHLRCRGTTVRLTAYPPDSLVGIHIGQACDCGCAMQRPGVGQPRTVLSPDATPHTVVELDGRRERGWTAYEAGLLAVPEAAEIFDELLARLTRSGRRAEEVRTPTGRPTPVAVA